MVRVIITGLLGRVITITLHTAHGGLTVMGRDFILDLITTRVSGEDLIDTQVSRLRFTCVPLRCLRPHFLVPLHPLRPCRAVEVVALLFGCANCV